jgi:hypothetical protein
MGPLAYSRYVRILRLPNFSIYGAYRKKTHGQRLAERHAELRLLAAIYADQPVPEPLGFVVSGLAGPDFSLSLLE